ncbi:tRNA (5-methylaminomethyl-2-thiouridine)(34)-methyltransferase MnmD [Leptolyngbya sp. AN02str]|uniref:tRNA (5-methylaminomethyl-2-thiouridine)(34)-methyltransferase MnmD n=1 Tax=Leptolyngbya sp. AN02str TaxID=3423363 RepID=UPI003D31158A
MSEVKTWIPQPTSDGSFTFFSDEFGEAFHSSQGAKEEAFLKFATATRLVERSHHPRIALLDVCYGLGYNTAAALETIWAAHPQCHVTVYGLERDASVPVAATQPPVVQSWSPQVQTILTELAIAHRCTTPTLDATLLIGDARQTIQTVIQYHFQADAIFFDPFSPRRCPQLWTVEFFKKVGQCLAPSGILATYSRSASVRAAMLEAGFTIGTIPMEATANLPSHEWAQGTVASRTELSLPPLSPMEQEHLQTRAAIPYRDPTLSDDADAILARQLHEQQGCQRESTSSWRRRWSIQ